MNPTEKQKAALSTLKESLPEIKAIMGLHAKNGVNLEALALQELDNLQMIANGKPEIYECMPQSVLLAVKNVLKQNLTLDPYAGLVYVKTRNLKTGMGPDGQPVWAKILEIQPSANGLISIARQCGRILDMKRPEVTKDDKGKVTGCSVEILLPSAGNTTRWEKFSFDESDFIRWRRASDKENGRGKNDVGTENYKYANANYTNWQGGIDPEFARAKAVRHALKKLGTNQNEVIYVPKTGTMPAGPLTTTIVESGADESAANDEHQNGTVDVEHTVVSSSPANESVVIPNSSDL